MKTYYAITAAKLHDPIHAGTAWGKVVAFRRNKNCKNALEPGGNHTSNGIDFSMHIVAAKPVLDIAPSKNRTTFR